MKVKICRKCGSKMPEDREKDYCETCIEERKKIVRTILGAIGGTAALAGGGYLTYKNFDKFRKLISNRKTLKAKGLDTKSVKKVGESVAEIASEAEHLKISNYMSSIDRKKIDLAVKEYGLHKGIAKTAMKSIENGSMSADDFLKTWGKNEVIEAFPKWTDGLKNITPEMMKLIIMDAAKSTAKVSKVISCDGKHAEISFKSNSGRSAWTTFFTFVDEAGNITDKIECRTPYIEAGAPRSFATNVIKRLKILADQSLDS